MMTEVNETTARAEVEVLSNDKFEGLKELAKKYYKGYKEANRELEENERLTRDQMNLIVRTRIFNELKCNAPLTPFKQIYEEFKNGNFSTAEVYPVDSLMLDEDGDDKQMYYVWSSTSGSIYNYNLNGISENDFIKLFKKRSDRRQVSRIKKIYRNIKEVQGGWKENIETIKKRYVESNNNLANVKISNKRPKKTINDDE